MARFSRLSFASLASLCAASALHPTNCNATFKASDPSTACNILKASYSNITYLPDDALYTNETEVSWTADAWLKPACIFAPTSAADLSFAVKTFANTSTLFAMRGGGHMPIPDAANINSTGVLISSTNLKTLQLSNDKQTLSVGPGPRWGDVYDLLDGTNLTVVGGRLAPVGVPGLLLGGGMSWYSYAQGPGSSQGKIKAYEAVLADGTIATVTANSSYSDLYWALQGGGSNFGLITRFDMQTFHAETPLLADATYNSSNATGNAWLANVLDFTVNVDKDGDTAAAVIPLVTWGANYTAPVYSTTLFYNGSVAPTTGPFAEFINGTTLEAVNGSSTMQPVTLSQYGAAVRPAFEPGGQSYGINHKFRVISTKATLEAVHIVHDNLVSSLKTTGIANRIPGFLFSLAYNCVTRTWAEKSAGSPQDISPEPQFWVEQSISWNSSDDTAAIEAWIVDIDATINAQLEAKNLTIGYTYLNDADKGQEVFQTYGEENLRKLKSIRAKYDPSKVFTELMPGGFKIEYA